MRALVVHTIAIVALCALTAPQAKAAECGTHWNGEAVPGTLASASKPCPPAQRTPPEPPRAKDDRPGVWRNGNTTIYYGGSISTEFGVGGGSRRR
jgi:hypothetical protein